MEKEELCPNVDSIELVSSNQQWNLEEGMSEEIYEQEQRKVKNKIVNRNLHMINFILVMFGALSIIFIVSKYVSQFLPLFHIHYHFLCRFMRVSICLIIFTQIT